LYNQHLCPVQLEILKVNLFLINIMFIIIGFKISDSPLAYLIDTPGICVPKIYSDEMSLKLSLIGCINDKIAGKEIIVEYMIYKLN